MGTLLVRRGMSDVFGIGEGLAMSEVQAPNSMVGYTLEELEIRKRYELNINTIKRLVSFDGKIGPEKQYKPIGILTVKTTVKEGDDFLLVGRKEDVDKLLETN
jgi:trk system potassium uptake protein TrkA